MRDKIMAAAAYLLLFLTLAAAVSAQVATSTSPQTEEADVVKITTKLVQVDAIVTDKAGKQVRGLTADNFRLLQDGKPQTLTGVVYVNTDPTLGTQQIETTIRNKNGTAPPPVRIRNQAAGRIIAFVVDDGNCSASAAGMRASREGLEKFVKEQMLATDRVAIYQTRSGSGMLQQYTNDKTQLLKAASKVRWYPSAGSCATSDGSYNAAAKANTFGKLGPNGSTTVTIESADERKRREAIEDFNRNTQIVGTLGVMRYVITGLGKAPGRKVMMLLSDGLPMQTRAGPSLDSRNALRDLTDLANRSSVVINTLDNRGVYDPGMIEARDEVIDTKGNVNSTSAISSQRLRDRDNEQNGLSFIADETGGNFFRGQNYLDAPIKQALDRETGYYILAYEPDTETFKSKKFNKIEITVDQPKLKVAYRSGFLGVTDEAVTPKRRTGDSALYEALIAPLPQAGLDMQLTAYFVNSADDLNAVRSLIHLSGEDIIFVDDGKGMKRTTLDVAAVAFNEKNEVVDEFTRAHTLRVEAAALPLIAKNGLAYSTDVRVKKPGTYNFRVAIRDNNSKLIGTASQVVNVPDLKKNTLFVSGLTVTNVGPDGKFEVPAPTTAENAISILPSTAVASVRRFTRGSILAYSYSIYNAVVDKTTGQPKLMIQTNLYRNGQLISEGSPQPADLEKQADLSRITDYSYLRLDTNVETGDYALQVIVRDTLAAEKRSLSSQWIDFEIVD